MSPSEWCPMCPGPIDGPHKAYCSASPADDRDHDAHAVIATLQAALRASQERVSELEMALHTAHVDLAIEAQRENDFYAESQVAEARAAQQAAMLGDLEDEITSGLDVVAGWCSPDIQPRCGCTRQRDRYHADECSWAHAERVLTTLHRRITATDPPAPLVSEAPDTRDAGRG